MTPARVINDHYVLQTDAPGQLQAVFPDLKVAVVQGKQFVAVPQTLEAARVLNNLGVKVHSPIRDCYGWPGRYTPKNHQVETAEFFTLNPRAFCLNGMGCVDASTEFLTPKGWKRIDQYESTDLVGQYDLGANELSFVPPLEYIKLPCPDPMIRIRTEKGIDQLLSGEHRVLYRDRHTKAYKEISAADLCVKHHRNKDGFDGGIPTTFRRAGAPGVSLSDADLRVMVAVMADGCFPKNGAKNYCVMGLTKVRKKERLRKLLTEANMSWRERVYINLGADGRQTTFLFQAPIREKRLSSLWEASQRQLEIIADEMTRWDGSIYTAAKKHYCSMHKSDADFAQYAFAAAGFRANICQNDSNCFVVSAQSKTPFPGVSSNCRAREIVTLEPSPDGFKYCFSVPSTYLVLRRNNKVFITGNSGKTLSALWAADYLQKEGQAHRALVVAPLSTLEPTWGNEIFQNFPLKTYAILHGSRAKRLELLAQPFDIYLVNHDGLEIISAALATRQDINLIILDELATYRNQRSRRWKTVNALLNKSGVLRIIWGLTGAPTPNEPPDAFAQMKLVKPENYRGHFTSFKHETMLQVSQFKWVPKRGAEESVNRILKPSVRFALRDCVDLPETIYTDHLVHLSDEQKKHYRELINKAATEVRGTIVTAINAAVLVSKIIQAASGAMYGADGSVVKVDSVPRVKVLKELIEGCDQKVIVFVPLTAALQAVAAELSKSWAVAVVDGSTSMNKRNQIFREFRSCKTPRVIVANAAAMSHGLSLTEASLIIWYAPVTSNDTYTQANARIVRPGQKFPTQIARIYATAEERRIYDVLEGKGKFQDIVLGLASGSRKVKM